MPYTLYPLPYTLYPIPYTLYPIPYTLYPAPYILNEQAVLIVEASNSKAMGLYKKAGARDGSELMLSDFRV
jgi:hypothetical protein